jgi:flagellar basal body P-ring formation protein FlgA
VTHWPSLLTALAILGFVPGAMAAEPTVVVANATIYPGQVVNADLVARIPFEGCDGCAPGYVVDEAAIIGKIAGKTILPNRLIYPEALRLPAVIKQGANVTLVYQTKGLVISVAAKSQADAAAGETVSVRSALNNQLITGVAQPDGTVMATGR